MYGYLDSSYYQDLDVVKKDLAEKGIDTYTATKANHCVMVCYGRVVAYYIVRNGKIADIVID